MQIQIGEQWNGTTEHVVVLPYNGKVLLHVGETWARGWHATMTKDHAREVAQALLQYADEQTSPDQLYEIRSLVKAELGESPRPDFRSLDKVA